MSLAAGPTSPALSSPTAAPTLYNFGLPLRSGPAPLQLSAELPHVYHLSTPLDHTPPGLSSILLRVFLACLRRLESLLPLSLALCCSAGPSTTLICRQQCHFFGAVCASTPVLNARCLSLGRRVARDLVLSPVAAAPCAPTAPSLRRAPARSCWLKSC